MVADVSDERGVEENIPYENLDPNNQQVSGVFPDSQVASVIHAPQIQRLELPLGWEVHFNQT